MTDTDWKPKNPCQTCSVEVRFCPLIPAACNKYREYIGEIKGQKRLLRDLLVVADKEGWLDSTGVKLQSMLKELEANNAQS